MCASTFCALQLDHHLLNGFGTRIQQTFICTLASVYHFHLLHSSPLLHGCLFSSRSSCSNTRHINNTHFSFTSCLMWIITRHLTPIRASLICRRPFCLRCVRVSLYRIAILFSPCSAFFSVTFFPSLSSRIPFRLPSLGAHCSPPLAFSDCSHLFSSFLLRIPLPSYSNLLLILTFRSTPFFNTSSFSCWDSFFFSFFKSYF